MKKVTPETIIKRQVKDYLKLKGWFVFHNFAGLGVYPGISDFTAIKDGKTWFIEIKTKTGKQSENQIKFHNDVIIHGGRYFILKSLEDAINFDKFQDEL